VHALHKTRTIGPTMSAWFITSLLQECAKRGSVAGARHGLRDENAPPRQAGRQAATASRPMSD
jgi:hypothetical protein